MCPVVLLALILSFLLLLLEVVAALSVAFNPSRVEKLKQGDETRVAFSARTRLPPESRFFTLVADNPAVASVADMNLTAQGDGFANGTFTVRGNFLGHAKVRLVLENGTRGGQDTSDVLPVSVIRKQSLLSLAFTVSVAVLVSLNYINMGCALDMETVKNVLRRPIGPIVGFFSQYLAMPLVAYGMAKWLFSEAYLQLGLFTFGCSPGGGASNMWTVLLGGNLNLSVAMTFISTIASLGTMPLWLFTLGRSLFEDASVRIPFRNIFTTLVSMTGPLAIGLLLQRFRPKVAAFCKRILAPVSVAMIVYIVAFGTYANLYMFKLMSWRVLVAAAANVWVGFAVGAVATRLAGLAWPDVLAVSVETGVQNTGIAIVLLGFSLPQPEADIAAVVPVAASIVTPVPLLVLLLAQRVYSRCCRRGDAVTDAEASKGVPPLARFAEVGDDLDEKAALTANGIVATLGGGKAAAASYGSIP
uniref:Putative sodium-bile acid cotransporter n=2 Tax=Ixodes ricinus TaxID=34613 RepID=V5H338_IXORI